MNPFNEISTQSPLSYYVALYKKLEHILKIRRRTIKASKSQNFNFSLIAQKYDSRLPSTDQLSALRNELLNGRETVNNHIFQYWHQGGTFEKAVVAGAPWGIMHKLSVASIERYCDDTHVILDKDTLYNYIDFPHDIMDTLVSMRKYPLLSDLIRTALLFAHGGTWMDFTLYLLNNIPDKYKNTDLCFFIREGEFNITSIHHKDLKHDFLAHSPYYFGWHKDTKVNMLSSYMHATKDNQFLGTLLYIMFDLVRTENIKSFEYLIYQIATNYLLHREEFKNYYKQLSQYQSDACCHILQVFDYVKYDNSIYKELKEKFPIQKLNAGCRFIKGSLLFETVKKELGS